MKNTELRTAEVQKQTDAQLQEAVANGKGKMPGYKGKLSKEQIAGLVTHIRSLRGASKAAIAAESKAQPAEAEKPAAPETSHKSTRTEMEAMHKEHLEAVKAQFQKLHADLDRMKANVDQITDASEKARAGQCGHVAGHGGPSRPDDEAYGSHAGHGRRHDASPSSTARETRIVRFPAAKAEC